MSKIILWTGKTIPFGKLPDYVCVDAYRWVLEIDSFCIGFMQQLRDKKDGHWMDRGRYYSIWLNHYWSFGRHHMYYDGPHDSLNLGFLHFCWQPEDCDKCFREG